MATLYQVIAFSSADLDGSNTKDEPKLLYPDALKTAGELKSQGKAFRVIPDGEWPLAERQAFENLGAVF